MSGNNVYQLEELYNVLLKLKTKEDCQKLLADLCTKKEIDAMAQRVTAAKLLLNGETYEKIIAQTDISSATLSRVSKCVKYSDGYKKFISQV